MLRVWLEGAGASGWRGTGVPDEYVPILFSPAPEPSENGEGSESGDNAERRLYTVAAHDADRDELVIDVVDHPGGLACAWAATARPGDRLRIGEPQATFAPPADATTLILAGDATALPAITRILEGLPAGTPAYAVIEVADEAERRSFATAADARVSWHYADPEAGATRLPVLVAAVPQPATEPADSASEPVSGPAYWWVAGEAAATRAVRRHLRHERGVPKGYWTVFGYWRHRAESWRRDHAGVERAAWDAVEAARRAGLTGEDLLDAYDDALDAGLADQPRHPD